MHSVLCLVSLATLAFSSPILKRQYLGVDTENQLTDGTACRAITILFARGTVELGNVGELVGPEMFQAVVSLVGSSAVAVQGVAYPADILGFLEGGDASGSALMASLVSTAQSKCPSTKLVLSGYSQGGQLVHKAAAMLTAAQTAFVDSVVIFGDPDNGKPVGSIPSSKVYIDCHIGDDICLGGDLVLPPHLTYAVDVGTTAKFIVDQAGL